MDRLWMVLCLVVAAGVAHSKVFEPAELAQKLHSIHISDWDIPSLVCLAHNASSLNTSHTTVMTFKAMRRNISFYGIFGIPEVWLDDCGVHADKLVDDDIEDDAKCIQKSLEDRLSVFDRTDYLGALTPHVVNLNKCFDWWESLPPYILSEGAHFQKASVECKTEAPTSAVPHVNTSAAATQKALIAPTQPPITTTCKCDSSHGSALVDISLILLNITLIALCYILWVSFVQRRTVKSDTVQFL